MASERSKSSGKQAGGADSPATDMTAEDAVASQPVESGEVTIGDTSLTAALFAPEKQAIAAQDAAETPEISEDTPVVPAPEPAPEPDPVAAPAAALSEPPVPPATPPAAPAATRSGPGLMPLLLGGVVVAGLGYGAAYMGLLGSNSGSDQSAEIAQALQAQSEALSALQAQVSDLASGSDAPAEIDLSPVLSEITGLSDRLDGTSASLADITSRIGALEDRPVFTGEVTEDNAAMAAAMTILQDELGAQQAANEELASEMRALSEQAQAAIADAETQTRETIAVAMAEAEETVAAATAEAEASVAAATAQAALSRIRAALASGDPFSEALGDLPDGVEVPAVLAEAADTGVPPLATLQARFPALAREALSGALVEVSADGTLGDRALAYLRSEFAGRAITPREGDDPDAVLSRVQAAVNAGDLVTAVAEIAALPDGAQEMLAGWTTDATHRSEADAALATLATALDSAN